MKGFQKSYLRGIGQRLRPAINVGKKGLDEAFFSELQRTLDQHELIKVRFAALKDQKKQLAARIAEKSSAEVVGIIGHTAVLYRQHPDPAKREIRVPERPDEEPPHPEPLP